MPAQATKIRLRCNRINRETQSLLPPSLSSLSCSPRNAETQTPVNPKTPPPFPSSILHFARFIFHSAFLFMHPVHPVKTISFSLLQPPTHHSPYTIHHILPPSPSSRQRLFLFLSPFRFHAKRITHNEQPAVRPLIPSKTSAMPHTELDFSCV